MTIGLFLDGYFHQNRDSDGESFVTPWHAVFYAGFTASALWLAAMSQRRAPGTADWRCSHSPPRLSLASSTKTPKASLLH